MLIDTTHPLVQALLVEWRDNQRLGEKRRLQVSKELSAKLAQGIASLLAPFRGQLVLAYHEFLTMEPTGEHSFAHGLAMWSKTVYWVRAARLDREPKLIEKRSRGRTLVAPEVKIRFAPSVEFLVPVAWQRTLHPYYPSGSNQPAFGFTRYGRLPLWGTKREPDTVSESTADPFGISYLGDYLFRLREGQHDWATKVCLVVGTKAVKEWLEQHASAEVYQLLRDLRMPA
jgi:hypothetical protein